MIQRIQSLFLLLSSILYSVYWFYGLDWYLEGFNVIKNLPLLSEKNSTIYILDPLIFITTYTPLIISILCFISIFFFKIRKKQILISKISFYLSFLMCINTIWFFYFSLNYLASLMPSMFMEVLLYLAIINPFVCTILIYFSIRFIKRDSELVNSLNRIR
jgi:hypothetical protein